MKNEEKIIEKLEFLETLPKFDKVNDTYILYKNLEKLTDILFDSRVEILVKIDEFNEFVDFLNPDYFSEYKISYEGLEYEPNTGEFLDNENDFVRDRSDMLTEIFYNLNLVLEILMEREILENEK